MRNTLLLKKKSWPSSEPSLSHCNLLVIVTSKKSLITDHHNKYHNNFSSIIIVWNSARMTKMWLKDIKCALVVGKMTLLLVCHKPSICLKKKNALKWNAVKRDMPGTQLSSFPLQGIGDVLSMKVVWETRALILAAPCGAHAWLFL